MDNLIFTLRPNNTSLWLPESLTLMVDVHPGDRLTPEQFAHPEIARLLEARRARKQRSE